MSARMKVIYTPEGGSSRSWVIDLNNPAWDITSQTEKVTDWPWEDFRDRLTRQSALAYQALLWVLRRRDEPRLQLDSVQVDWDELDFEAECPNCKVWVGTEENHACPEAEAPEDEPGEA